MENNKIIAALFDFDGVVVDTEGQYSSFWGEQGRKYLDRQDFADVIKGMTLREIFSEHFAGREHEQQLITDDLNGFESRMSYDPIPGITEFVSELRRHGVKTAIVTSSNALKMQSASKARPELKGMFDVILTADDFTRSKPDPQCYRKAMEVFGAEPHRSVVFEDSFAGLESGRRSGAFVVGLATTNPAESIENMADMIIEDFNGMTFARLVSAMKLHEG